MPPDDSLTTKLEEVQSEQEALAIGLRAAVAMVAEDVHEGAPAGTVTVTVSADGVPVKVVAVSLSVAPLLAKVVQAVD